MKKITLLLLVVTIIFDNYSTTYIFNNNQNISIINGRLFIDGKEVSEHPPQEETNARESSSAAKGTVTIESDKEIAVTINITGTNLAALGHIALSIQTQG